MNYVAVSGLLTFLSGIICSLFLFFSPPRTNTKNIWSVFSLAMGLWGFGLFMSFSSPTAPQALFWARFLNTTAILIPVLFFYFALLLLNKTEKHQKELILYIIISLTFFLLAIFFEKHFVKDITPKMNFKFYPTSGFLYYFFPIQFSYLVCRTILILIKEFLISTGLRREQLKYVLIGSVIGFSGGGTTFPLVFDIPIYPFGVIQVPVYLAIITYAIIKYRLMDIHLAITRAGIFICVYTLVLGLPFGLTIFGQSWLIQELGSQWYWVPMILLLILSTSGPYLFIYLQNKAENTILQEQITYQKTLKQASYGIGRIKKLDTLFKLIERTVTKSAKIQHCSIYLNTNTYVSDATVFQLTNKNTPLPPNIRIPSSVVRTLKSQSEPFIFEEVIYNKSHKTEEKNMAQFFQELNPEVIIPIVQSNKLLALILLGKKKNKTIYTNDDLTVFSILASQAGLAIENCMFMQAEQERIKEEGAKARRESLDMLVGTMAHEIDNPVTSALGPIDLIKEVAMQMKPAIPQETYHEFIAACDDSIHNILRISKIVNSIEKYSKGGEGELIPTSIYKVLDEYRVLIKMAKKDKQRKTNRPINYTEDIEDNLPMILAEDVLVEEILVNLVENAFHAVGRLEGERNVKLTIKKSPDQHHLRMEVLDNGYGMEEKIINQVFEVPTTTKGSMEGTGLGLYRVRKVCEILNAKRGCSSPGKDQGALFYVEIPFLEDNDAR